jgi:hypothetical protein
MATDQLRNVDLQEIATMLKSQRVRTKDVVVTGDQVNSLDGTLRVGSGTYRPNRIADEGLSTKLDIPRAYLRRMHETYPALYDQNVNGWLGRYPGKLLLRLLGDEQCSTCLGTGEVYQPDQPWVPCPDCEGPSTGVVRAVLSDRYRAIDNLDVLLAALGGIRKAGVEGVEVEADLTERRMYVRVTAPSIAANASALVRDYRDPYTGRRGDQLPCMWAGLVITNSETGNGSFSVTPRVVLQVCKNGQTITADAMRAVHLGGRLDEGEIQWSDETLRRNLDLITSQSGDAVVKFLSVGYVEKQVQEIAKLAGVELHEPAPVIEKVSKRLGFTETQAFDILNAFVRGGEPTSGGVMHAVTAVAQRQDDGDSAADMESKALTALALAAGKTR